jgi:hypothetical protein
MPNKIISYTTTPIRPNQLKYTSFLDKAKDDEVFPTREIAKLCGGGEQVHRFDTSMIDKYSTNIPNPKGGKQKVWGHPDAIKKIKKIYGN